MTRPDAAPAPETTPRPRWGRRIGIIAFAVVAGVIVLALIAASVITWTVARSFPQRDGEIALTGLSADVTVERDALGVPVVTADSTDDLFFAQGYVQAQDRFWEMDFRRHVTSGRLSELFGESQLGTDLFLRTLGWRAIAEEEVAALDETVRGYYDAYAEGVNAYLADHDGAEASFEYAVLGLQNPDYEIEPWTAADSVAWLKAMAWDLRANIETEATRALAAQDFTPEQLAVLYPEYPFEENPVIVPEIVEPPAADPDTQTDADTAAASLPTARADAGAAVAWTEVGDVVEAVSLLVGGAGEGIGSNSWVLSGRLTDTGMPLLANDPHLGASLPSVWHQIGLKCRTVDDACPFDVAGYSFAGLPGVIIGHNDRIAWGFTNLAADVTDLYVERLEGDAAWKDGELVPLDVRTETVRVAGGDDVELTIRETGHGPIISDVSAQYAAIAADPYVGTSNEAAPPTETPDGEYAISLRWTALDPGTTASAIFTLNTAQDFADFREAAAAFDVPAQNLVYADVDGNIGYQTPGRLPIRGEGDGALPHPGWDSAYDWEGFIPFEELPVVYNPDEGFIVTANNALVDDDYPYALTRDWDYGYRAARITDMIERRAANGPLTAEDMRQIQADNQFQLGIRLSSAMADIRTGDADVDAALDLLATWDAQNDADSAAAAFANVLWDELAQNLFTRERDTPAPLSNQSRLFLVVDDLLAEPDAEWWVNEGLGVASQAEMLTISAEGAYARLVSLQGENMALWNWGDLHALELRSDTFGSSGIAPLEWLFNRGPVPVGGGASVANATGWDLGGGFETLTVPSMRMVVDLGDLDASEWHQLTGVSGHVFHDNYIDQVDLWRTVELAPWPFTAAAVTANARHTLTLTPAD